MKSALLFLLSILIVFASGGALKNKPKKKNAVVLTELMKIMDEEEGFYQNVFASISPDGKIVVLDGGNKVVNVYSSEGEKLSSFGKEGSGPGEFSRVFNVGAMKNRIAIRDQMNVILFDYNGSYLQTISLMGSGNVGSPTFLDETILVHYEGGKYLYQIYDEDGKEVNSKLRNDTKLHKVVVIV